MHLPTFLSNHSSLLLILFSISTATASTSWPGGNNKQISLLEDPEEVPGDNPLTYCGPTDKYIAQIDKVDLDPNPPLADKNLTILASGTLTKRIEKGAAVKIAVKYGVIRLLTTTLDLCDYAEEVDLECPLEKGKLALSKVVALPKVIPPGKYTVNANVVTVDGDPITCFDAVVSFSRP